MAASRPRGHDGTSPVDDAPDDVLGGTESAYGTHLDVTGRVPLTDAQRAIVPPLPDILPVELTQREKHIERLLELGEPIYEKYIGSRHEMVVGLRGTRRSSYDYLSDEKIQKMRLDAEAHYAQSSLDNPHQIVARLAKGHLSPEMAHELIVKWYMTDPRRTEEKAAELADRYMERHKQRLYSRISAPKVATTSGHQLPPGKYIGVPEVGAKGEIIYRVNDESVDEEMNKAMVERARIDNKLVIKPVVADIPDYGSALIVPQVEIKTKWWEFMGKKSLPPGYELKMEARGSVSLHFRGSYVRGFDGVGFFGGNSIQRAAKRAIKFAHTHHKFGIDYGPRDEA